MFNRIEKRIDARSVRAAARDEALQATHSKEGERFLLRIARGPQLREGPRRWRLTYNSDFAQHQLENVASDYVHDVKIDVFTSSRVKPRLVSTQTILLSQLAPSLPMMLPLGALSRAKDFIVCVRWDDSYGTDQLERFRVADAPFEN